MIAWRSDTAAKVIFANYCFDVRLKSLAFFIFFYFLLKLKLSFVTEGSRLVQSVSANKFKFFTEKPNVFYEHLPRALGPQNFVITIWNWRLSKSAAGIKSNQKWRIILFAMERNGSVTVHMRFTEDKHSGGNNNI